MKVRVLTAIVGIIAVLCLVWLGGWFLTGAVFLVSLIALAEYDRMLKQLSIRIYRIPAAIAIGAVVLSAGFYSVKVFTAVIFLSFCLLLFLILSIKKEEMTNLVYTSFGSLYFGLGFGTLALLRGSRELLPAGAVNGDPGIFLILFALVCTWASDSFAYLVKRDYVDDRIKLSGGHQLQAITQIISCAALRSRKCQFLEDHVHGVDLSEILRHTYDYHTAVRRDSVDRVGGSLPAACEIHDNIQILVGKFGNC